MHSNASFQRNERTRRDERQQRAAVAPKPCYAGKKWTRTDHKRAAAM